MQRTSIETPRGELERGTKYCFINVGGLFVNGWSKRLWSTCSGPCLSWMSPHLSHLIHLVESETPSSISCFSVDGVLSDGKEENLEHMIFWSFKIGFCEFCRTELKKKKKIQIFKKKKKKGLEGGENKFKKKKKWVEKPGSVLSKGS